MLTPYRDWSPTDFDHNMTRDERAPVVAFVHWEGEPMFCEECNAEIESAYGPVEDVP